MTTDPTAPSAEAIEAAAASIFWDRFGHGWSECTPEEREPELEEARHALEAALPLLSVPEAEPVAELWTYEQMLDLLAEKERRLNNVHALIAEAEREDFTDVALASLQRAVARTPDDDAEGKS